MDLNLSSLLALNDRITSTITEVESVLSITLPRAVNKAVVESGDSCTQRRDRGFTEPAINTSSSIFTWPARLSINVSGGYSSSEAKESPVGSDNFIGDLSVSHFSDLDSLTSTGESCLAQRDRGTSSIGSDFFPRTALSRQGTRTQMPLPSLHELMTSLRRGSAEDVAKVADLIYYLFSDMAGYRRRSNSTSPMLQNGRFGLNQVHCRLIKSIVEQGGLLVLLQALARCTEWPEVEIKVLNHLTLRNKSDNLF